MSKSTKERGRIYLLGRPGSGKSYLCNIFAKDDYKTFYHGDSASSVTKNVSKAPSIIEGWDIYDTPGFWNFEHKVFQKWWREERSITHNKYIIFIIVTPIGGRFSLDDLRVCQEIINVCNTKKNLGYYLIV